MPRGLRAVCLLASAFGVLASAGAARAQPSPAQLAAAQTLFDEARTLMSQRRYAEACPKLEESQRLDPGPGTRFHLAECYERLGRTASAWATFTSLADEMRAAGQREREQVARAHADALQPALSRLAVTVPPAARVPGLAVTRDGEAVHDALWGSPIPVDPGTHEVSAHAPGRAPWRTSVDVRAGVPTTAVTVPVLGEDGGAETGAPAVAPAPSSDRPAPEPGRSPLGAQRVVAIAAAGLGVVGLGVGGYFGLVSMSKHSDYVSHCVDGACDATGLQLHDQAVTAGNVSTVFFVLGAVGVAAGAVLWLTAPSPPRAAVGLAPNGVVVRGSW